MQTTATAPQAVPDDERARLQAFAARLDAIKARVESELGNEDVLHVKKIRAFSRAMEITGRTLIHFSLDPLTFWQGHRATVVNLNAIERVTRDLHGHLVLRLRERKETLSVSESFAHLFRQM